MAFVPNSGSVVAFQSNPSVLQTLTGLMSTNASVITAQANQSVSGTVQADVRGSVATVIIGGSIAASFTPPANQSVSGTVNTLPLGTIVTSLVSTVPSSVLVGSSIFGQLPAGTATIGSVAALQATNPWIMTGSVQGVFSVIGTLPVTQSGGWNVSIASTVPSSVIVGASIFGQLPAGTAMLGSVVAYQGAVPWAIAGSVAAIITNTNTNVSGSVVAFQGTSPWVVNFQNSSILSVPVGSTITVLQAPSIVGTYAEDSVSASGDKGFLVMGARNDTLSSVTSNDGDYSSHVVGPAGELIAENAPLTKWVSGTASMLGGVPLTCSVTVIAAQGASIFTYITGVQVANFSASSVLVSFGAATSSLIAYTIAPAGGGSNIYFQNGIKTNANAAFSASVSGTASVYISAQGFISKT